MKEPEQFSPAGVLRLPLTDGYLTGLFRTQTAPSSRGSDPEPSRDQRERSRYASITTLESSTTPRVADSMAYCAS